MQFGTAHYTLEAHEDIGKLLNFLSKNTQIKLVRQNYLHIKHISTIVQELFIIRKPF